MSSPTQFFNRRSGSLDFTRTTEVYFCHECRRMHSVSLSPSFCCAVCSSPCVELIESDEQFKLLMPTHTRTLREAAAAQSSSSANSLASPMQSPNRQLPPIGNVPPSFQVPSSLAAAEHQPRPYAVAGTRLQGNVTESLRPLPSVVAPSTPSVPLTTVIVRTRNSDGTETEMTAAASGSHGDTLRQAVTGVLRAQLAAHAPIVVETSTRSAPDSNVMVTPQAAIAPPAPVLRSVGLHRPRPPTFDEPTTPVRPTASTSNHQESPQARDRRTPRAFRTGVSNADGIHRVVMTGSDLMSILGMASGMEQGGDRDRSGSSDTGHSSDNADDGMVGSLSVQNLILAMLGGGLMGRSGGVGSGSPGDLQSFLNGLFSSQPSHQGEPTPQTVIDSLHTVPEVTAELREQHLHLNNACAVCQESLVHDERSSQSRPTSATTTPVARSAPTFNAKEVIILPCNHCFHKDCLLPWLERSQLCPVCRKNVTGRTEESQADELD